MRLSKVLALLFAATAGQGVAQSPLALAAEARNAPGGTAVASLLAGATVTTGATKGAEVVVTVEGWVDASRLGAKRDTFPASVRGPQGLRVRATPSPQGRILGEFYPGAGILTLGTQGAWTHVRRSAWIPLSALGRHVAPGGLQPNSAEPAPPGSMAASRAVKLLTSPIGDPLGDVAQGVVVQPLARDRGWMRVRVEGWVQERDFSPADTSFGATLTAADLRVNPEGTRGKLVRWEVQVFALQTADPLRRDLGRDEPYLLAKGPGNENALLYLAVPPSLLTEAKTIAPLTMMVITARVRTGHSEPVGTPILDLTSISKR